MKRKYDNQKSSGARNHAHIVQKLAARAYALATCVALATYGTTTTREAGAEKRVRPACHSNEHASSSKRQEHMVEYYSYIERQHNSGDGRLQIEGRGKCVMSQHANCRSAVSRVGVGVCSDTALGGNSANSDEYWPSAQMLCRNNDRLHVKVSAQNWAEIVDTVFCVCALSYVAQ